MQFFVKFVRSALKVTLGLAKGSVIINYLWRGEGGGGRGEGGGGRGAGGFEDFGCVILKFT